MGEAALDLFAGPGGWDVAAARLGIYPLGIEFDEAACATREAAGHRTLKADVAALDPADFAPCELLIASPPCQAWSMAGQRKGELDKQAVYEVTADLARGRDTRAEHELADDRSLLVVEPLRWILALRPRLVALEQVPPVLDYWSHVADILRAEGYGVWTGILEAERYGVPQTRERAILMASLDGPVHPPAPTHQRYVPGQPARHEVTFGGEILPWVSMAQALGWDATERVGWGRKADDGAATEDGYRERDFRDASEPAFNLTEKGRSWMRADSQKNASVREAIEPAPTIKGGNDTANRVWTTARPATTVCGDPIGEQSQNAVRVTEQEAAVLQGFASDYPWQGSRTKQFQQIGNAVPPPLAEAILRALSGGNEDE